MGFRTGGLCRLDMGVWMGLLDPTRGIKVQDQRPMSLKEKTRGDGKGFGLLVKIVGEE